MNKLLLLMIFVCGSLTAQNIENTYRNPVIACDFPDPTVIRVGDDYYAAGTTTDFAPNYPIYHSKDLINWERIGAVFAEPPASLSGCFWAPELYYNDGTFFVYYTAKRKSDNISCIGVASTKDITKGFKDHGLIIEWGNEAIDAFIFKDDDGKLYISWKAYGLDPSRPIELLMSELSADGLSLKGEYFTLTDHTKGWIGRGDEGQCIIKRGEYYYMLYSIGGCCDNRCDYRVHVSRSKSLRGDWEQYEKSSLMEGGESWKCTGHGTLVQTPDGRYFYLYHAYHMYDFEFMGRQGLLDEMLWDDSTGWPYFRFGNTPTTQASVPFKNTIQKRNPHFYDNFNVASNQVYWQWDMKLSKPEVLKSNGQLTLTNKGNHDICFYGTNFQTGNYEMETSIMKYDTGFKGLSVYGDPSNLVAYGFSGPEMKIYKIKNGIKEELFSKHFTTTAPLFIKIESVGGRLLRFYWSEDQKTWNNCMQEEGNVDGSFIPRWGTGLRSGFLVENTGVFQYFSLLSKF